MAGKVEFDVPKALIQEPAKGADKREMVHVTIEDKGKQGLYDKADTVKVDGQVVKDEKLAQFMQQIGIKEPSGMKLQSMKKFFLNATTAWNRVSYGTMTETTKLDQQLAGLASAAGIDSQPMQGEISHAQTDRLMAADAGSLQDQFDKLEAMVKKSDDNYWAVSAELHHAITDRHLGKKYLTQLDALDEKAYDNLFLSETAPETVVARIKAKRDAERMARLEEQTTKFEDV